MTGPMHGVRIIDLTSMISGPLATMLLADQGADVIKVENPERGDHVRSAANRRGNMSAAFLNNNRNKRSIAINLKDERGKAILKRLCADADVFVQNFRPGVAERMGIGEDAICEVAPSIIYVSISGFGERGPYSGKPVYDPIIQALSGLASIQGGSDQQRPRLVRTIVPDKLTGVTGAQAIAAALFARERTGQGQHVRLSMLETVVAFLWSSDMGSQTLVGESIPQQDAASYIDLIYETQDGYVSVAVMSDREWQALTRALERPQWLEDPRFKTPALRDANLNARLELIQEVLRTNTSQYWLTRLEEHGVPCVPVLTRNDMIQHPQVHANDIIVESEHPQAGTLRQARAAARFSHTATAIRYGAPGLGQHTDELLGELGLTSEEVSELRAAAVISG